MKVLEKYHGKFSGFNWLNFDYLPESKGFKFEVYFQESDDEVAQSILAFYLLFRNLRSNILIRTFRPNGIWGNFCLDTWDMENDKYDYSPENKQEPTASYLSMLQGSGIEPSYSGFCQCINWDKFLHITLHCIMQHVAPYSMMFYVPQQEFVFYFHHSGSIGLYYKELNEQIVSIIRSAQKENFEITNVTDERVNIIINMES